MSEQKQWFDDYVEDSFICPYCHETYEEDEVLWQRIDYDGEKGDFYRAIKCEKCENKFQLFIWASIHYRTAPHHSKPIPEKPKFTLIKGGKE